MSPESTQQTFRAILDALARPTKAFDITGPDVPPTPLSSGAAAIARTLCDEDTPVWLDPALAADGTVAAWFAFHTGAPVIADPGRAAFVFATAFEHLPPLSELAAGTDEEPHRSATVVLEVTGAIDAGNRLYAVGPGINGGTEFAAPWAPPGFVESWQRNTAGFPKGVDFLLVDGAQLRGLPRTTKLARASELEGAV